MMLLKDNQGLLPAEAHEMKLIMPLQTKRSFLYGNIVLTFIVTQVQLLSNSLIATLMDET